MRKLFGKYLVADPEICHGKLTFVGTRIFVRDVLDMVAAGMDWDDISKEWRGSVSREAIREAIQLATRAFLEHLDEYVVESVPV
jgi:uncharacterized protein (DUF433 family)